MTSFQLSSGDCLPAIGLGTWQSSKEQIVEAINCAIDTGYRHIDCASIYMNEKNIGDVLKPIFSSKKLQREALWITSKLWNSFHQAEHVESACKQTLSDLRMDYLDLYLIHWPIAFDYKIGIGMPQQGKDFVSLNQIPLIETWKAMESLLDKGLVKNIGISNFSISKLDHLMQNAKHKPVVNQVESHPYLSQPELLAYCKKNNVCMTAYSPLGSGNRFEGRTQLVYLLKNEVILSIAEKHRATPAQVVLAWQINRGVSVIPKSTNPVRIKENFAALTIKLDEVDNKKIDQLNKNHRYIDGSFWALPGSPYTVQSLWS